MSFYSTIHGTIKVKTRAGLASLRKAFESWTDPENARYGALVEFEDLTLRFDGYYRSAGYEIEPAIAALRKAKQLVGLDIHESTTDGFTGTYDYFLENGVPKVRFHDKTHRKKGVREIGGAKA